MNGRYWYGRVSASPGKHGEGDLRVEFEGKAPTHAESLAMLGFKLIAEDRYNKPGQLGRRMLLNFVRELEEAKTVAEVAAVAHRCQSTIRTT